MTPLQYYQQQVALGLIKEDSQQKAVLQQLQQIYRALLKRDRQQKYFSSAGLSLLGLKKPIPGLYVWGSVGVGKTFLMDIFYHCLTAKKLRLHLHEFMERIHKELAKQQGRKNPLDDIAHQLARETHVVCLDEFFVFNIADAMLMKGLLSALFREKLCLVASSNVHPDDLYKNGLQRENFIPTIELIKQNTHIIHMPSHHDYRLEHIDQAGVFFTPLGVNAERLMETSFQHFSNHQPFSTDPIRLFDRTIRIRKKTSTTIWFEFTDLCGIPRSQKDFLALAQQYRTFLISHIPIIRADQDNLITSFINLIDVFYDARVKVVISAEAPVEALYPEGKKRFDFARTQSRLIEMQSATYFTKQENTANPSPP